MDARLDCLARVARLIRVAATLSGAAMAALASLAPVAATAAEAAAVAPTTSWDFRVALDGAPIGSHRFVVTGDGDAREVTSRASFAVKLLGITAYRYRHEAHERWRGACLAAIEASTDDDGTRSTVRLARDSESSLVAAADGTPRAPALPPCAMSFAYWHPAMRSQTRLLNAQTGQLEPVQMRPLPDAMIVVQGRPVAASGVRIVGPTQPIDVWYDADGRWIGLDSLVGGGKRKLSYRLP